MTQSNKLSPTKRVILFFSAFLAVLFLFLATIPLWFDVDHYRPQIVSLIQQYSHGKVTIGKLSLSAWGEIKVRVDGLEFDDTSSRKVLSAKSIYAELPFYSILNAKPVFTLVMEKPEIFVIKDKNGKLNLLTVVKTDSKEPTELNEKSENLDRSRPGSKPTPLPLFLMKSQLNLRMKQAKISYSDLIGQQQTEVKDLNLEMLKVSLGKPFDIRVNADLNTRVGNKFAIVGPLDLKANIDTSNQRGEFQLELPGLQLESKVKVISLSEPSGEMELKSSHISFGQWMKLSDEKVQKGGVSAIKLTDLIAKVRFKSGKIDLDLLKFKMLGGLGNGTGKVSLVGKNPSYSFSLGIKNIDLNQAAESQSEILRNIFQGMADFEISGQGQSFEPDLAMKYFSGTGTLNVKEAKFRTLDVGQMIQKGLGESLIKIIERIPVLRGKQIAKGGPIESEYEFIKSDFQILNGILNSPNFQAKAKKDKGLDLKGNTQVELKDCRVKADWQVIDSYNLTKARDLSVEQAGVKVEHILAQGNGPVVFPVMIEGSCQSPQVKYEAMTASLIKVVLGNVTQGAVQKATQEIGKKIGEELQKEATKPLQDALKGLFRK